MGSNVDSRLRSQVSRLYSLRILRVVKTVEEITAK